MRLEVEPVILVLLVRPGVGQVQLEVGPAVRHSVRPFREGVWGQSQKHVGSPRSTVAVEEDIRLLNGDQGGRRSSVLAAAPWHSRANAGSLLTGATESLTALASGAHTCCMTGPVGIR